MFYFAWVTREDIAWNSAYAREDEKVFSFRLTENETEFPSLSVTIQNPRDGLLAAIRNQWVWFSADYGSGIEPLFFGRIVGAPQDFQNEEIVLDFTARPTDWEAQREALAEGMRELPLYDPVFIPEDRREDPDAVLDARLEVWHVNRVTHEVTTTNVITGETGTIVVGDDHFYEDFKMNYSQVPIRSIRVKADVAWEMKAKGTIDIAPKLQEAAAAAGSLNSSGDIQTYTGVGLAQAWPTTGQDLGGGWIVGQSFVERGEKKWLDLEETTVVTTDSNGVVFPVWSFRPTLTLRYKTNRQYKETIQFTVIGATQPLVVDTEDQDIQDIALSSTSITLPIDEDGSVPMYDTRRRSYFMTDRGHYSLEYLINLAKARIIYRARAVNITFACAYDNVLNISCKDNVYIADARLPGGVAAGKVISYTISGDGDSGTMIAAVTIGCTIGLGEALEIPEQTDEYIEGDYVEGGFFTFSGPIASIDEDVYYEEYTETPINDDGIDLFNLTADDVVVECELINGKAEQDELINTAQLSYLEQIGYATLWYQMTPGMFTTPSDVVDALAEAYSQFCLQLVNMEGGPFETIIPVTVSALVMPKTIDLRLEGTTS